MIPHFPIGASWGLTGRDLGASLVGSWRLPGGSRESPGAQGQGPRGLWGGDNAIDGVDSD